MIFTIITRDLQKELKSNMPQIMILLKKQPAIAYKTDRGYWKGSWEKIRY